MKTVCMGRAWTCVFVACIAAHVCVTGSAKKNWGLCLPFSEGVGKDATSTLTPRKGYSFMFSFGANMGSAVFAATGVQARSSKPAVLHGHCLVFDARVASGESNTVYANVKREPKHVVHGIVHEIRTIDLEQVFDLREQCHIRRTEKLQLYSGETVEAQVYVGNMGTVDHPVSYDLAPTHRYLKLMFCGARERRLHSKYVAMLKKHLPAVGKNTASTCHDLKVLPTPIHSSAPAKCAWAGNTAAGPASVAKEVDDATSAATGAVASATRKTTETLKQNPPPSAAKTGHGHTKLSHD